MITFIVMNLFFGLSFLAVAYKFAAYYDKNRIGMHAVFDVLEAQ